MSTEYDENGVITNGPFKGTHTRPPSVHGGQREMVWHRPVDPTENEYGDEVHPAWGMISVHKVSTTPGAVLFGSDIRHQHLLRLNLRRTSRDRNLNRDWLHPTGPDLIEVDMSEAQWAAFVSSMNTQGVECTIRATETQPNVNGLKFAPRLKESLDEIKGSAEKVFGGVAQAVQEMEDLGPNAGIKARREALAKISNAVANAEANLTFAATSLEQHAENVVQKSRADIEAMVYTHAERLGLDPAATLNDLALGYNETEAPKAIEGGSGA